MKPPIVTQPTAPVPQLGELWSKAIVRWSSKFVLNAELSSAPCGRGPPQLLKMSPSDLIVGQAANSTALVEQALAHIPLTNSHAELEAILSTLREVAQRVDISADILDLDWAEHFQPFFRILPESSHDELVFSEILQTLLVCLTRHSSNAKMSQSALFRWLFYIVTSEKHTFWVLFQGQCLSHSRSCTRLWPSLLRFVATVARLSALHRPSQSGSFDHVMRILSRAFEQDDQSQVYQLNSLKLILDCLVHVTMATIRLERGAGDDLVIDSLFRKITSIVVSFSASSAQNGSSKGRCVVQCCSQLTCNLLILLKNKESISLLSGCSWLLLLLQYGDPVVKTAALQCCLQAGRYVLSVDNIKDTIVDMLTNLEDICIVLQQAALLLSQHPHHVSHELFHHLCRIVSAPVIQQRNQSLLAALLKLLTNSLSIDLQVIVNDVVPVLPSIWTCPQSQPEVRAAITALMSRAALCHPSLVGWLLKQPECISVAVGSLCSSDEQLVENSAFFLTLLLDSDDEKHMNIVHAVLKLSPDLQKMLLLVRNYSLDSSLVRMVFFFLQNLLSAAWVGDESLQLDAVQVALFSQWILSHLPGDVNDPLRKNALRLLGTVWLFSAPVPEATLDFFVKELKLQRCSDDALIVLIGCTHNLIVLNATAEKAVLQRGVVWPMIDIWKANATHCGSELLESIVDFAQLVVCRARREILVLFKLMLEYLEEREAVLSRQLTLISDKDWNLIECIYQLLAVAVDSLECRRLLVKLRCWASLSQTWHPVHLKRMMNRQQHWVALSLIGQRARVLSALTFHDEPTLPDLMDSGTVKTLMDVAAHSSRAQRYALVILRNMAFHQCYKTVLLKSNTHVFWSSLLTGQQHAEEDTLSMAVSSLIALASNNMRVKSEIRSLTEAWFQRNPVRPHCSTALSDLYLSLQKLIDH